MFRVKVLRSKLALGLKSSFFSAKAARNTALKNTVRDTERSQDLLLRNRCSSLNASIVTFGDHPSTSSQSSKSLLFSKHKPFTSRTMIKARTFSTSTLKSDSSNFTVAASNIGLIATIVEYDIELRAVSSALKDLKEPPRLKGPKSQITDIKFDSTGNTLIAVTAQDKCIYRWTNILDDKPILSKFDYGRTKQEKIEIAGLKVACNSNATVLAVGFIQREKDETHYCVQVIMADGSDKKPIDLYNNEFYCMGLAFSPDDTQLVLATRDSFYIPLWNIANLERNKINYPQYSFKLENQECALRNPYGLVFSPDGTKLAGGNVNDSTTNYSGFILDLETRKTVMLRNDTGHARNACIAFKADGLALVTGAQKSQSVTKLLYSAVFLWDKNGKLLNEEQLNMKDSPFLGSLNHTTMFVAFDGDNIISASNSGYVLASNLIDKDKNIWKGQNIGFYSNVSGLYFPGSAVPQLKTKPQNDSMNGLLGRKCF